MEYTPEKIAQITGGNLTGKKIDLLIEHLLTDSRRLIFPGSTLFFALHGARRTGGNFIAELYSKGVRCFVTLAKDVDKELTEAAFVIVPDVLKALQQLAAWHRSQFTIPVIGITGSNGKTIVKEWLYHLLQPDYNIIRSPKSYNSQSGVPLSVWPMKPNHTLGIFEAGISLPGEMQSLEKIIRPTLGIFTNIGDAHSEGFQDIKQKIREKLQLFTGCNTLVYCSDNKELDELIRQFKDQENKEIELFSWGMEPTSRISVNDIVKGPFSTKLSIHFESGKLDLQIPFIDEASIQNAIHCCCVLKYMEVKEEDIVHRLKELKPVEMRLELKQGINNCSVINDSYNSDVNALTIALNFLMQQQQHPKRTVILSDILQSGKTDTALYSEVAGILKENKINRLIGIGNSISAQEALFEALPEKSFFHSIDEFRQHFPSLLFHNETILLKGARIFEFEDLAVLLEQKLHHTRLEINLPAIVHNLHQYQRLLKPSTKMMVMVKAFSYGSGSYEIANLLQFQKVDYLAVAYTDEGVALRKAGITLPIMVMNAEESSFEALVQHFLEPELYSRAILDSFIGYLENIGINFFPVHIKLDTGMHRLGFEPGEMNELCQLVKANQSLKIQSVFSHLAGSDDPEHDEFTQKQFSLFLQGSELLRQATGYDFIRHIANSSAISRLPDLQLDMVRLGIGIYGVDSNKQLFLENVTTLVTTIAQIKRVKAGETVGYNRKGIVKTDSVIATVRIGYADGYSRDLGNGAGKMLVSGKLAPVIGNVCMDMTMLDITGIDGVSEGDEVIVFGKGLSLQTMALWANTIPYEVMTGISQRVNRVYFED